MGKYEFKTWFSYVRELGMPAGWALCVVALITKGNSDIMACDCNKGVEILRVG